MIPAAFDYHRPESVDEALRLLGQHGEDAKLLAGGHSLIPAMRLRLAEPKVVVDISRLRDLRYIRAAGSGLAIGAMSTHFDLETSNLVRDACPLLSEMAPQIGDVQVRNKGTLGGSLVHADPAADWPAGILALEAELDVAGSSGRRTIKAAEFFVDLFQVSLKPDEILCEIRVPGTARSVAYEKARQKASGFALVGAAVVLAGATARVGITGVAGVPYRAREVERSVAAGALSAESARRAADHAADGIDALGDMHASAEFRSHLARVYTARALIQALSRV
jgi:carbon-monoxide dehydrogenase medium subunit